MRTAAVLLAALASASGAVAQPLADRVADAGEGAVQFSFPAREGVCGDGDNIVGFGRTLYIWPSIETHGSWSGVNCVPGPVRVRLTLADGRVTAVRTHVGEPRRGAPRAVDLGAVSAREAADYLLSLAARLDGKPAADAILPAVLADAGRISPALLRIARDASRPREARKKAIMWVGTLGEEGAVRSLDALTADDGVDASLREQALAALAFVPDGGGVESLVRLARGGGEMRMRRKAAFWLGNADDPRARRVLRELASDDGQPAELRGEAIFALGHLDTTPEDAAFLRALYPRLTSDALQEKVIQSLAQTVKEDPQSLRWLLARVADEDESPEARKKALFWAAQQDETPITELVRLYPRLREAMLKEHYTFVLSQRDERAATDELIRIARTDPDPDVRKKALFWLGQRDDPRAAAFIRDAILKPNEN